MARLGAGELGEQRELGELSVISEQLSVSSYQ